MSTETEARVHQFARQTIDLHLPLLLGSIAERGGNSQIQVERASQLVEVLSGARLEPQLMRNGRPVPVELRRVDERIELFVNQTMLERVDDEALASAMALPVAKVLGLPPSMVGLILNLSDERQIRSLASQLGSKNPVVPLTQIERLVRWRLQTLEARLGRLIEVANLTVDGAETFLETLKTRGDHWPRFEEIRDQDYLLSWSDRVGGELGRSVPAEGAQKLVELLWESLVISPRSAMRQAAQALRSLPAKANHQKMLVMLARALGEEGQPIDSDLQSWPSFEELHRNWEVLNAREDALIGARRSLSLAPPVCIFAPPSESMGLKEPASLPWEMPLICWSMRERSALNDLLKGLATSLEREMDSRKSGRLQDISFQSDTPLPEDHAIGERIHWIVKVPTRLPTFPTDFSTHLNQAFKSTAAAYGQAFSKLPMMDQIQGLNLAKGAYSGYLPQSRAVWQRRLITDPDARPPEAFEIYLLGLARALEWPIFVDIFEEGLFTPRTTHLPGFTLLATWCEDSDFAPLWLPVEAIGEALGQVPLRIRNIEVRNDGSTAWLGDHRLEIAELRALSTDGLLRGIHDGALLLTIHKI